MRAFGEMQRNPTQRTSQRESAALLLGCAPRRTTAQEIAAFACWGSRHREARTPQGWSPYPQRQNGLGVMSWGQGPATAPRADGRLGGHEQSDAGLPQPREGSFYGPGTSINQRRWRRTRRGHTTLRGRRRSTSPEGRSVAQLPAAAPRQARAAGLGRRVELLPVVPPAGVAGRGARGRGRAAFSNVSGPPRAPNTAEEERLQREAGPAPRRYGLGNTRASDHGRAAIGMRQETCRRMRRPYLETRSARNGRRGRAGAGQHPESGPFIEEARACPTDDVLPVGAARAPIAASGHTPYPMEDVEASRCAERRRTKSAARARVAAADHLRAELGLPRTSYARAAPSLAARSTPRERGGGARGDAITTSVPRGKRVHPPPRKRPPAAAHARRGVKGRRVAGAAVGRDARGAVDDLRRRTFETHVGPSGSRRRFTRRSRCARRPQLRAVRGPRRRVRRIAADPPPVPRARARLHVRQRRQDVGHASDVLRPGVRDRGPTPAGGFRGPRRNISRAC